MTSKRIAIIGAGLSGLSAAYYLEKEGHHISIFEKEDRIGGYLKTSMLNGFELDHGFHYFLDKGPEVKAIKSLKKIPRTPFISGGCYLNGEDFQLAVNPKLQPKLFCRTFKSQFPFRKEIKKFSLALVDAQTHSSCTIGAFIDKVLKPSIFRDNYLKPLFRALFLDPKLEMDLHLFSKLYPIYRKKRIAIPQGGIRTLADTLHGSLKKTTVRLQEKIIDLKETTLYFQEGKEESFDHIIFACELRSLQAYFAKIPQLRMSKNTISYFEVTDYTPLLKSPALYLLPQGDSCLSHYFFLKQKAGLLLGVVPQKIEEDPEIMKKELSKRIKLPEGNLNFLSSYKVDSAIYQQDSENLRYLSETRELLKKYEEQTPYFFTATRQKFPSVNEALYSGRLVSKLLLDKIEQEELIKFVSKTK